MGARAKYKFTRVQGGGDEIRWNESGGKRGRVVKGDLSTISPTLWFYDIGREYRSPLILSCITSRHDQVTYPSILNIEHLAFRARRKTERGVTKFEIRIRATFVSLTNESRTREGEKKEEQRSRDKVRIYIKDGIHFGKVWDGSVCVWRISREILRASINTLKFSGIECTSPSLARSPFHKGTLPPLPLSTWVQQPPSTKSLLLFLVREEVLMPGVSLTPLLASYLRPLVRYSSSR